MTAINHTPVTDSEIRAAGDRAMELARATLFREAPFLGVFGAAAQSGIADKAMARVCGYAYLCIIQNNTTSITTGADNVLTEDCIKGDAAVIFAATLEPQS